MRSLDYLRSVRNVAVIALAVLAAMALPAPGAAAQQRVPWVVVESHGDVTQRTADGTLAVAPGATLAEGAPVTTGSDGTLVLAHGNDRVTVSANSAFTVPAGVDPATGPSILQTLGTLLFKVEHTPGRRFEVDTPYLAAVVKGTVFTVSINDRAQMVHVAQGAVEVTALASHDAVLVRPGQTATLSSPNAAPSVIEGRSPAGTPGNKSEGNDAPRDDRRGELRQTPPSAAAGADDDSRALHLTRTLGDQPLDVGALTHGLVKAGKDAAAPADTASPNSAAAGAGAGSDNPSLSVGAGASMEMSSTPAAVPGAGVSVTPPPGSQPVLTVNAGTPVGGVTVPVSVPPTGVVPPVVDPVIGAPHGASPTAKIPGANSPAATGRKLP